VPLTRPERHLTLVPSQPPPLLVDVLDEVERVAPVVEVPVGPLLLDDASPLAVVLDGVVLKETRLPGGSVTEPFAAGDVLVLRADTPATSWVVHRAAALAPLSHAPDWPTDLLAAVHAQLAEQCHRASVHLAILGLPRVEDRILALLGDVAVRLGRVAREGVLVDLPLTHRLLGRMVAARRPTVSLALAVLAEQGRLRRRADGTWVLPHAVAG
jgi:CRP/FNR family transcriptional regulator, cyclic AMP receptor protein